jgi:hypothetical protein
MERSETEVVGQRHELLAGTGDIGLYLCELAFVDGRRRTILVVSRGGHTVYNADPPPLRRTGAMLTGDSSYPVHATWGSHGPDVQLGARLQHEWLRWNPLDLIPAPFRWLVGLKAQPQRVWADADVVVTLSALPERPRLELQSTGIAVVTFQQPVSRH